MYSEENQSALRPVRTVAPSEVLIPDAEAVRFCRVADDAQTIVTIANLVSAATDHIDGYDGMLGRALVTQTWRQDFGYFACKNRLPLEPVQSISGITYYDSDNAQQTLATSVYQIFTDALGVYVGLKPSQTWPSTYCRPDAVSVTFVAGYGAAAAVPAKIKLAALQIISHWNEHREAAGPDMSLIPLTAEELLYPYKRTFFV